MRHACSLAGLGLWSHAYNFCHVTHWKLDAIAAAKLSSSMLSLSMAISRALYEGAKRTHACIVRSYPRVTRVRNVCNTRVTRVRNACDTRAFVKLPLVGTV